MTEAPLDLRSLGAVDSPEVVSSALRRFRRRVFSTGAVVFLAAASLLGGILWAVVTTRTLEERIAGGPGTNVGAVFNSAGATVVLTRVADVDSSLGLSFLVARSSDRTGSLLIRIADAREFDTTGGGGVHEVHLLVPPSGDGIIRATLLSYEDCTAQFAASCSSPGDPSGTFAIDLEELDVPQEIWKEGNDDD